MHNCFILNDDDDDDDDEDDDDDDDDDDDLYLILCKQSVSHSIKNDPTSSEKKFILFYCDFKFQSKTKEKIFMKSNKRTKKVQRFHKDL